MTWCMQKPDVSSIHHKLDVKSRADAYGSYMRVCRVAAVLIAFVIPCAGRADGPLAQKWDYAPAMQQVAARGKGRAGVVLHVGDSITYANPYSAWARSGEGKSPDDKEVLDWMHMGADDDSDGWYLARFDHPDGGRSYTAAGGLRADELLRGGKGLPRLDQLLQQYRPQIVVYMLGTNDASAGRQLTEYIRDVGRAVDAMLKEGVVPIVSTIPPHVGRGELARDYNHALRGLCKERQLPLIDFEAEIMNRRPDDWDGTLLGKGDVHPTAQRGEVGAASAPTSENLRSSGYLLRGWLSVQKIGEVKRHVFDKAEATKPARESSLRNVAPPRGEPVRAPITRDTYFSNVGDEVNGNNGGSGNLKLKSIQEMSLLDFDAAPLVGRKIEAATLHVYAKDFRRVTTSSFASDWVEGTGTSYEAQKGSSSFRWRAFPNAVWAGPGSDLCAVILGQGGTVWGMADAWPADAQGWQRIAIDPRVIAARVAGVSYGLLAFDDTGSEWTRNGEAFQMKLFPNRFFASRDRGGKTAPYLTIYLGEGDQKPPEKIGSVDVEVNGLRPGEAVLRWKTPTDVGQAGTAGFLATIEGKPVPQYLLPSPAETNATVECHLRDLGLSGGQTVSIAVQAVDGAGNRSAAVTKKFAVANWPTFQLPGAKVDFAAGGKRPLVKIGKAEVAIIDPLDKVQAETGELIPPQPAGYFHENHFFNANGEIVLHAAKNEFTSFQIALRGPVKDLKLSVRWVDKKARAVVSFGKYVSVATKRGLLPDPIVPLDGSFLLSDSRVGKEGQRSGSLLCEVYIPHKAVAGVHRGALRLETVGESVELPVSLTVWDFTLPDRLSFLAEMNCYGLPDNERDYYRLAHRHRTVLNRVPYYQNGVVADGCAPKWDGKQLDWSAWDRRFGQYFDGSAFADLPRAGASIECFYLPLHENWPGSINDHYNGSYWADEAFTAEYRQSIVEVARQFAEHFNARQWHETLFHAFLNGKNNYKERGWSRGSSPWLLDEPASFQDYVALRWFGEAFHEGFNLAAGKARLLYRCDISRPQWQRDTLDDVLDYNVVMGGPLRQYRRLVRDRQQQFGQIVVEYGSSNAIEQSNLQPVAWSIDSWCQGNDGVLPWQTVGAANDWKQGNAECLFYPAQDGKGEPTPSVRLKAYCRGQQDVEYLTLLAHEMKQPRWAVAAAVLRELKLAAERRSTGFVGAEDAGVMHYGALLPQDLHALRIRIGQALSELRPKPVDQLVEFRTPRREVRKVASGYISVGDVPAAGVLQTVTADAKRSPGNRTTATGVPGKKGREVVVVGPGTVVDTLIDPTIDQARGSESRNNAIRRQQETSALLVRFDLSKLRLPVGEKLGQAFVEFSVWDPSSHGRSKLAALPVKTDWGSSATWREPAPGKQWSDGAAFSLTGDCGEAAGTVIVEPDAGADIADPAIHYRIDVTNLVRGWLQDPKSNRGLALAPQADRAVDDGQFTRFQVYASEAQQENVRPRLMLKFSEQ